MKKFIAVLAFLMTVFPGKANEYTEFLRQKQERLAQISELQEIINGEHWLTTSLGERIRAEKNLEIAQQKLKKTEARITEIENDTVVTITQIELEGVSPSFDRTSLTHADLYIFLTSEGEKNPFIDRSSIGKDVTILLQEEKELPKHDCIEIKDNDVWDYEDMGEILTDAIIEDALKNSSDSGCYVQKIENEFATGKKTYFTVRIYYRKYQKSERRR